MSNYVYSYCILLVHKALLRGDIKLNSRRLEARRLKVYHSLRGKSIILALILAMIFPVYTPQSVSAATTPASENFESRELDEPGAHPTPRTIGDWTFRAVQTDGSEDTGGNAGVFDNFGNKHLLLSGVPGVAEFLQIKSASGAPFKLVSFKLAWMGGDFDTEFYRITGYRSGLPVVDAVEDVDAWDEIIVTFTDEAWNNIDEFRIATQGGIPDLFVSIDDLVVTDPVTAPGLVPVSNLASTGKTATTVSLNWSEANEATAIAIEQSPAGQNSWTPSTISGGTLAASATSATVTSLGSATAYDFRLVVTGGSNAGESNIVAVTTDTIAVPSTTFTVTNKTNGADSLTFPSLSPGYSIATSDRKEISVTKVGSEDLLNLQVSLSGGVNTKFVHNASVGVSLGSGVNSVTVLVQPKTGLPSGTHTETLTVTDASSGFEDSMTISFTVLTNAATPVIQELGHDTINVNDPLPVALPYVVAQATDGGELSYQWYESSTGNIANIAEIPDATSEMLVVSGKAVGTYYYFVAVTNTNTNATGVLKTATVFTEAIRVTVTAQAGFTIQRHDGNFVPLTNYTFPTQLEGYTQTDVSALKLNAILAKQLAATDIQNVAVSFGKGSNSPFEGDPLLPTALAATVASTTMAVFPKLGLTSGTYSDTITITADGGLSESFQVNITIVDTFVDAATPVIHSQPVSKTVTLGEPVTLNVSAGIADSGTLYYQWVKTTADDVDGTGGVSIENANDPSYQPPTGEFGTSYYYVALINVNSAVSGQKQVETLSQVVTVTVNPAPIYSIAAITNQTARSLVQGYAAGTQQTLTLNIENTGAGNLTGLSVVISGANSNAFELTQPASTLASGAPATSFTVAAKNGLLAGTYVATITIAADQLSAQSFTVTQVISSPSSNNNNSGSGGSNGSSPTANEPTAFNVLVNGKVESAGKATTTTRNNQSVTTVEIDQQRLEAKLEAEAQHAVVTIPVSLQSDVLIIELNGSIVRKMEQQQTVVVIQTDRATYTLPLEQIQIEQLFPQASALDDIKLYIEISTPTAAMLRAAEQAADNGSFTLIAEPIEFTIHAQHQTDRVAIASFDAYVARTIELPEGTDLSKITTGVIVEANGTVRHVPTKVVTQGENRFARINSLTNSTYALIWNPLQFADMSQHWAEATVNDMASRLIVNGTSQGVFSPNETVTRAEFAAMLVRGLGLSVKSEASVFSDVKQADWYYGVVQTAHAYGLIDGFEDGTFQPNLAITREQAMHIVAKAMVITGLNKKLAVQDANQALQAYGDAQSASAWAMKGVVNSIGAGIVQGRSERELAPQALLTRAEVAVMIHRLLRQSDLI